jgi:hypothetical protein
MTVDVRGPSIDAASASIWAVSSPRRPAIALATVSRMMSITRSRTAAGKDG